MARGMSRAGLDELLDQGANHGNNLYKAHGQPAAHPVAANQTHPTRPDHSRLGGWHGPGRDAHDQSAAKIGRQLDEHNEYNHARQQIREQARQGQAHGRKRSANNLAGWRAGERALAPLAHTRRGKLALLRNGRARLQTAIALADAARHGNRAAAQKLRELRHAGPAHATPAAAVVGRGRGKANPAELGREELGKWAAQLKRAGIGMDPNVPNTVCCANWVMAKVRASGWDVPHTNRVLDIPGILIPHGWHWTDRPHSGCVAIINGEHTELVDNVNGGKVTLIGSNNTGHGSGPQQISYSNPYGHTRYLAPPS